MPDDHPTWHLTVDTTPRGKARHRTGRGHEYTPRETKEAEAVIREAWRKRHGATLLEGSLAILITAWLARPQTHYNAPRKDGTRTRSRLWTDYPQTKPDWDNYGKLVCDALQGVAFRNDSQIADGTARKRYVDSNGETPGWDIIITRVA